MLPQLGLAWGSGSSRTCQQSATSWGLDGTAVLPPSPHWPKPRLFVLVAGSGLPWPLPPGSTEPEALLCSGSVSAHIAGHGYEGGPSPGLGRRGRASAPLRAVSQLAVPCLVFMPLWGGLLVSYKWGERRTGAPCGDRGEGAGPRSPGPRPCPRARTQPPGALSPAHGLLLCLILFFT